MPRKVPDLSTVPDEELFKAAKERYQERREELGRYFTLKKFRICRGCGKKFTARELRAHKCSISWLKR